MNRARAGTPQSLGICVTTRSSSDLLLGLADAATRAGIATEVFLTGDGVELVRDGRFRELVAMARVSVCDASLRAAGLDAGDVPGLADKDFVTQWRNAEMVERCDRYVVV